LAVDSNEDLIQVPVIAESTLSSLQLPNVARTELLTPLPDRLIGHDNPPLGEKILYISEAQAEAMVRPDRIADDLGRKTITCVTRSLQVPVLPAIGPSSRARDRSLFMASVFQFRAEVDNAR
jgi:hypothetical protein